MKKPAFQFYPADWLGSQRTALLTLEEEGAYIRLLCYCWLHGSIPSDPELIARLIGKGASTTLATTVAAMFDHHPTDAGRLVHQRLLEERAKQDAWREKSAEGGRKSAETRQNRKGGSKGGSMVVEPDLEGSLQNGTNQKATLQSSSSSSDISCDDVPPSRKRAVKRNPLIDALATVDGSTIEQITPSAWSGIGKAMAEIRAVSPDVTPAEIHRRAHNYRLHHKDATISAHALAKHWGKCASGPADAASAEPIRLGSNLKLQLAP